MRLLALLAVMLASVCKAVTTTNTLFVDAPQLNSLALLEANSGQVFARVAASGAETRLYRIKPDGRREQVPMNTEHFPVALLGNQVIALRGLGPRLQQQASGGLAMRPRQFQIVLLNGRSPNGTLLYQTPNEVYYVSARAAYDAAAVYVLAPKGEHTPAETSRSVLLRIDPRGAVQWRFEIPGSGSLLAIPGGVLVIREVEHRQTQIQALSDSGQVRWRIQYAGTYGERMAYMPSQRLAILQPIQDSETSQLLYFDVRNGQQLGTVIAPPGTDLQASAAGLLVYGNVRGEPHLSLLAPNGTQLWTRRLPVNGVNSNLLDAAVTRSGELLVVTHDRYRNTGVPSPRSIALLRTSATSPTTTPACLDVDPRELNNLEASLRRTHAIRVRVRRESAAGLCSEPGDPQYLQFLRELQASLDPRSISSDRLPITIEVHANETLFQRSEYGESFEFVTCCWRDCPRAFISYVANAAAGRELGMHLSSQVLPHLQTMERLQLEFRQHTRASFRVQRVGTQPADARLFPKMEAAVESLLLEARKYPHEQWRAADQRRQGADRLLMVAISADSIGKPSEMRPLSELPNTLRQLFFDEAPPH